MRARAALICCLALGRSHGCVGAARAADYPSRPIKLVVPYAAGGPTDVQARLIAEYLARDLKQTVFVENKAGAQGAIGAEAVAHGEPDGYTLLFTAGSVIVINPMLYKKLSYDPDRELRVLAVVTDLPMSSSFIRRSRRRRSPSSSPMPSKIPASSISARPAPAASAISPARCSSRRPASR